MYEFVNLIPIQSSQYTGFHYKVKEASATEAEQDSEPIITEPPALKTQAWEDKLEGDLKKSRRDRGAYADND